MSKYKLIALDFDGTLANSQGKITERTKEAIHRVAQTDATIVVATGRRFFTAKPRVMQLELPEVLIAGHNGAILKQLNGELLHHQLLPRNVAHNAVKIAKELGVCPIVFEGTQDAANLLVEDYGDRIDAWQRSYLQENEQCLCWMDNLSTDLPGDVIEVICVVSEGGAHQLARTFQQRLDGQVKPIIWTIAEWQIAFIGLSSPKATKREPLRYLAEQMQIDQSEILAIGDNYNDLDMLHFAGTGIIMANAESPLKQMGFHETASNDEDGVAVALEEFVLIN